MAWVRPHETIGHTACPLRRELGLMDGRTVSLVPGDAIEWALRQLKKRNDAAGLSEAMKRHEFHLPRGARRRRKRARAQERMRKAARRRGPETDE